MRESLPEGAGRGINSQVEDESKTLRGEEERKKEDRSSGVRIKQRIIQENNDPG